MELPSLERIKTRPKKGQSERHQEYGEKVANLLGRPRSEISAFTKAFKEHPLDYPKLMECAEWVAKIPDSEIKKTRRHAFFASLPRFLNPPPFKPRA